MKNIAKEILNKICKEEFLLFSSLIIYRLSLDFAYPVISCHVRKDMIISATALPAYFSWLIFLGSLPIITKLYRHENLLSNLTTLLYLVGFVPSTSLFMYIDPPRDFLLSFLVYWAIYLFASYKLSNVQISKYFSQKNHITFFYIIVLLLCAVVLYASWRFRSLSFHFDLSSDAIDSLRLDPNIRNRTGIISRMISHANKLLPIAMIYFLWKKKWICFSVLFLINLLNFGIAGHKTILCSVLLSITVFFFYRNWMPKALPIALACLNFIGIFSVSTFNISSMLYYFTGRIFFVPALLNYYYYDHFSSVGPDFMRSGTLGKFWGAKSLYANGIPRFIGKTYFNADQMACNNGLFSDAYANFGFAGCLIYPVILSISIWFLQYCCRNLPPKVYFSIIIIFCVTLLSSFLSTSIFTHGLAAAYILCYLISSANHEKTNSGQ